MKTKLKAGRWVALGTALGMALAWGGFSIAEAVIPAPGGIVKACYKKNGNLRVVDSAAACAGKETAIQWNQTGPTGPQGPSGSPGPQGPSGRSPVEIVTFSKPIGPGEVVAAGPLLEVGTKIKVLAASFQAVYESSDEFVAAGCRVGVSFGLVNQAAKFLGWDTTLLPGGRTSVFPRWTSQNQFFFYPGFLGLEYTVTEPDRLLANYQACFTDHLIASPANPATASLTVELTYPVPVRTY